MRRYYVVDMSDYVIAVFNSVEKQIKFYQEKHQRGFSMKDSIEKVKKGEWLNPVFCQ